MKIGIIVIGTNQQTSLSNVYFVLMAPLSVPVTKQARTNAQIREILALSK